MGTPTPLERARMGHLPQTQSTKDTGSVPPPSRPHIPCLDRGTDLRHQPLVLPPGLKFALGALQREATQGEPSASLLVSHCMAAGHPPGLAEAQPPADRVPPIPQDSYLQVTRATVVALSVGWCSSELPKGVPFHANQGQRELTGSSPGPSRHPRSFLLPLTLTSATMCQVLVPVPDMNRRTSIPILFPCYR